MWALPMRIASINPIYDEGATATTCNPLASSINAASCWPFEMTSPFVTCEGGNASRIGFPGRPSSGVGTGGVPGVALPSAVTAGEAIAGVSVADGKTVGSVQAERDAINKQTIKINWVRWDMSQS